MIKVSAPGKIHLLGEHTVVYGKPALLTTIDLRVTVTLREAKGINQELYPSLITQDDNKKDQNDKNRKPQNDKFKKLIESIVKKHLKIKAIPPYNLAISSRLPIGCGLGSSAALSAAYIAALLTFLDIKWDKPTVNDLAYEVEKTFHGNPSGGDNSTVVFGGLVWFRKETPDLKIIHPLPFTVPHRLAKNFVLINTGQPKETTKEMVNIVSSKFKVQSAKFRKIFDDQEKLVKELLPVIKDGDEKQLMQIIKAGERNLESIGVVSSSTKDIIRQIENSGGAAKICGAGGKTGPAGMLLCYHPDSSVIKDIAKSYKLDYLKTALGVEGLRYE